MKRKPKINWINNCAGVIFGVAAIVVVSIIIVANVLFQSTNFRSTLDDFFDSVTSSCTSDINEKIYTEHYDAVVENDSDDYVIAYKDEGYDVDTDKLDDFIVRLSEYQKDRIELPSDTIEDLWLFVDVYFDLDSYNLRRYGITGISGESIAYAIDYNTMVMYVDPDIPINENKKLYQIVSHELIHLLQYAYYHENNPDDSYGIGDIPDWYLEGMATNYEICLSGDWEGYSLREFSSLGSFHENFHKKEEELSAYREAFLFYRDLKEKFGNELLIRFMEVDAENFYSHGAELLGEDLDVLYQEFIDDWNK